MSSIIVGLGLSHRGLGVALALSVCLQLVGSCGFGFGLCMGLWFWFGLGVSLSIFPPWASPQLGDCCLCSILLVLPWDRSVVVSVACGSGPSVHWGVAGCSGGFGPGLLVPWGPHPLTNFHTYTHNIDTQSHTCKMVTFMVILG